MRRVLLAAVAILTLLIVAVVARVAASVFSVNATPGWVADGTDVHGDPLPEDAIARLGTVRFRTTTPTNLLWLDDGRLASGGMNDEIVIWDAATGARDQVLPGHREKIVEPPENWSWWDAQRALFRGRAPVREDHIRWGHLAQAGHRLISAGAAIREWDLRTGAGRRVAFPGGGNVPWFALRDDARALEYPWGNVMRSFDLTSGEELARRPLDDGDLDFELTTSADMRLRAGYTIEGALGVLETDTGTIRMLADAKPDVFPRSAAFGPDARVLHCIWSRKGKPEELGTRSSRLTTIDVASGEETARIVLDDEAQWWWLAACSPDGRTLVTSTVHGMVELRDATTLAVRRVVDVSPAMVLGHSFSPDGERLAMLVGGAAVSIVDVATGERTHVPDAHEASVDAAVFLDDERVLTAGRDGVHRIWEARSGRHLEERRGEGVEIPASRPHDGTLAVATGSGLLTVDMDGKPLRTRTVPDGWQVIRAAADGTLLLVSERSVALLAPDADAPDQVVDRGIGAHDSEGTRTDVEWWAPEHGRLLLRDVTRTQRSENSWNGDADLRLIDVATGETIWTDDQAVEEGCVDLVAGMSAVGHGDHVHLRDDRGETVRRLRLPDGEVARVAFSPDGRRVAVADMDGTVYVWAAAAGPLQKTLRGHGGAVTSFAWSPDGTLLVSTSHDTSALVWDVAE